MIRIYSPLWIRIFFVAGLIGSFALGSYQGLGHFALGLISTGFFLFVTWRAIQFFGMTIKHGAKSGQSMISLFIILGIKLPFIVWLSYYIQSLQFHQQGCFLMGLALVYSWLIGWAQHRSKTSTDLSTNGFNPVQHDSPSID